MNAAAEDAFAEFVADCGNDAYAIPASCITYLNQYMVKFPAERDLLLAGLQVGVPRHIMKHDGGVGYDDHLSQIADKFVAAADITPAEAQWAVGAWAYAVGRPVGFVLEKDENLGRVYADDRPKSQAVANTIITAIVVSGGFFGGLFAGFIFALFAAAGAAASSAASGYQPKAEDTVGLVLMMTLGIALLCAGAAWGGWWFGHGSNAPWRGFAVSFGTSFTTILILIFVLSIFVKPFVLFGAVFGACYKTAARGGQY